VSRVPQLPVDDTVQRGLSHGVDDLEQCVEATLTEERASGEQNLDRIRFIGCASIVVASMRHFAASATLSQPACFEVILRLDAAREAAVRTGRIDAARVLDAIHDRWHALNTLFSLVASEPDSSAPTVVSIH
jgi:hypothetical protein